MADSENSPPSQINGIHLGIAITLGMVGWRLGEELGQELAGTPGAWIGAIVLGMLAAVGTAAFFQARGKRHP